MAEKKKLHFKSSVKGFLRLVRLPNLLILLLTQYFVRIFIVGPVYDWKTILPDPYFFAICISTILVAAAGYIINDYYDIKIDIINKPRRVVIGRILERRVALFTHFTLNILALFFALLVGWKILAVVACSAFLLWLYSNNLKRLPLVGNLCVSFLTALSVYIIVLYIPRQQEVVFIYATFAFFVSLIREIIKDMEDVKGDSTFGCKTLPIIWGIRKTKQLLFLLIILFLISLSLFLKDFSSYTIQVFLILVLPPVLFLSIKLMNADTTRDFKILSNICKIIMICGVFSMIFI